MVPQLCQARPRRVVVSGRLGPRLRGLTGLCLQFMLVCKGTPVTSNRTWASTSEEVRHGDQDSRNRSRRIDRTVEGQEALPVADRPRGAVPGARGGRDLRRSEEHTYELQTLMRISYAVFCLTKKRK